MNKLKELYEGGKDFERFLASGNSEDREKTLYYLKSIELDSCFIDRIKGLDKDLKILVLAEIWCPDCMINLPAVEKLSSLNERIDYRIIEREGNEIYFEDYKVDGKVKIPTFIIMDSDFQIIASILERPMVLKSLYEKGSQVEIIKKSKEYREGKLLKDMMEEIVEKIN